MNDPRNTVRNVVRSYAPSAIDHVESKPIRYAHKVNSDRGFAPSQLAGHMAYKNDNISLTILTPAHTSGAPKLAEFISKLCFNACVHVARLRR